MLAGERWWRASCTLLLSQPFLTTAIEGATSASDGASHIDAGSIIPVVGASLVFALESGQFQAIPDRETTCARNAIDVARALVVLERSSKSGAIIYTLIFRTSPIAEAARTEARTRLTQRIVSPVNSQRAFRRSDQTARAVGLTACSCAWFLRVDDEAERAGRYDHAGLANGPMISGAWRLADVVERICDHTPKRQDIRSCITGCRE